MFIGAFIQSRAKCTTPTFMMVSRDVLMVGTPGCSSLFMFETTPCSCSKMVLKCLIGRRGGIIRNFYSDRGLHKEDSLAQKIELTQLAQDKIEKSSEESFHQEKNWSPRRASSKRSLQFFLLLFSLSQPCKCELF